MAQCNFVGLYKMIQICLKNVLEFVEKKGSKEEINLKCFILILKFETAIQGSCYPINLNNQ